MKVIECRGGPRQIGHTAGEELRQEIRDHLTLVARQKDANWRSQWERRLPVVRATIEEYLPDALVEMEAMAVAANLPVGDIFMANHLHLWGNDLDAGEADADADAGTKAPAVRANGGQGGVGDRDRATSPDHDEEGCSNIVFRSGPDGPLWGKNNDGHYRTHHPVQKPVCVKKIYPEHGIPMVLVVTCGSLCIGDGLNAEGVAIGASSVGSVFDQSDSHPAIRLWNYHALQYSRSTRDFIRLTTRVSLRGKGFSMVCVDRIGEACSIEAPCPLAQVRYPDIEAGINCVNYYQLPQLARADRRTPEDRANAVARARFLDGVLREVDRFDLQRMKQVLRHHGNPSICRAGEKDMAYTKYSMIGIPNQNRLLYCDGRPCQSEYEEVEI